MKEVVGGRKITIEQAIELRNLVNGSALHSISGEWRRANIQFRELESPFPYGLISHRNGTRGIITAIQTYLIKHLLFPQPTTSSSRTRLIGRERTVDIQITNTLLELTNSSRKEALVCAMASMLWKVSDGVRCTVCLPHEHESFPKDEKPAYREDGITEYIRIFEFLNEEEAKELLKEYISYFEETNSPGVLLFLYSLVLSRTTQRIYQDMGEHYREKTLLTETEDCHQSLLNLMLTGSAVPYVHNGILVYDEEGKVLKKPMKGVTDRSDIGYLYFNKFEAEKFRTDVGSMLKTPKLPIWLTNINGQYGVLFSSNPELLRNWRVEHRFTLHYYTAMSSQTEACKLTVDTRHRKGVGGVRVHRTAGEDRKIPTLELCIMTKWPGADISWNGTAPFV
ncbi:inactive ubiquitin carboxyl-terminal hydrolase MINDY-4B-like [Tubulanus polymorphus]|uniref:inactive ubiquitin carboxyl-terminal hydrolase MINDY-4B-like n=1 Tax=Tubulanus polymorphus TaxID=672921 RepID=UPI003DA573A5